MRSFLQSLRVVDRIPIYTASAALFILMVMTFCDVILRSSFDAPIEAGTELTRILVAVMVFSVLPHVSVTGGHIAVDLTDGLFRKWGLERVRDGIIHLASALMLCWPIMNVWKLAERTKGYGEVTQYLAIPQYLILYFIALSITITAIAMLVAGLLTLFAPSQPERTDP